MGCLSSTCDIFNHSNSLHIDAVNVLVKLNIIDESQFTFHVLADCDIVRSGRLTRTRRVTKAMKTALAGMVILPHKNYFTELSFQQKTARVPQLPTTPYDTCHYVSQQYSLAELPPHLFPLPTCVSKSFNNTESGERRQGRLVLGRRNGAAIL